MYDRSIIGVLYFVETCTRHEDYIFWSAILNRGIVAKGMRKVKTNKSIFISVIQNLGI